LNREKIRPRLLGLLNFISRIFALLVGVAFTTLVSRKLEPEVFGTWQYFSNLLTYFVIPVFIINFWATREVSRGKNVGRMVILLSFLISLFSSFIFYLLTKLSSLDSLTSKLTLLAFSIWIPSYYLATSAEALSYGTTPTLNVLSVFVFESSKLVFGILLVVLLKLSLFGAVLSVVIAFVLEFIFFVVLNPSILSGSFELVLFKKWFGNAWIPLIGALPGFISSLDVIILKFILDSYGLNSMVAVAYFKAALMFGSLVGYAGAISFAVYPKVLREGTNDSRKFLEEVISLTNMLGIPMVFGLIILSEPLLFVLREEYGIAKGALIVLSISSLIATNKSIFSTVLLGAERADVNVESFSKKLFKSFLFKVPFLESLSSFFYIISSSFLTLIFASNGFAYEFFPLGLAICNLFWNIPTTFYYFSKVRSEVKLNFPFKLCTKYIFSSIVMSILLLVIYPKSAISERLILVLSGLIPTIVVGAFVYFLVLILIDNYTRTVFKRVLQLLLSFL